MSPLLNAQMRFTLMLPLLINKAIDLGYQPVAGELERDPSTAKMNAMTGKGISNSLHCKKLALDLHLFRNGILLQDSKDYEPLGVYWESIGGSWGGKFKKPDGNHFSFAFEGVR